LLKRLSPFLVIALGLAGCLVKDTVRQDAVAILSNAAWLAYQDGPDRDWRVLVSGNEDTQPKAYALQAGDLDKRYALAMVCPGGDDRPHQVFLIYGDAGTVSNLRQGCEPPPESRRRYRVDGNVYDDVAYRGELTRLSFAPGETLEVFNAYATTVPEGPKDLLAAKGPIVDGLFTPRRFVIVRGLDAVSNTRGNDTTPVEERRDRRDLVFLESQSLPATPDPATLTVQAELSGGELRWRASVDLWSRNGNDLPLLRLDSEQGRTRGPFHGLVADYLQYGEGHRARLDTYDAQGRRLRSGVRLFTQVNDVALALPAPFEPQPAVDVTALSWSAPAEDAVFGPRRLAHWRLEGQGQDENGAARPIVWHVYVADEWMATDLLDGRIRLPLPDLAALPGWQPEWTATTFESWRLAQYFSDDPAGPLLKFILQDTLTPGLAFGLVSREGP